MNTSTSNKLVLFTLIALVLGILFGLFLPELMLALSFVGELFVNVLQVLFIPLVASAIITGVSAFAGQRQVAKAALATVALFLGTTIAAILIGIILTVIIQPGIGINTGAGFVPGEIINAPVTQSLDFLSEILPSNIVNAVTHGKFLGWMIVLIIASAVLGTLGPKSKPVTDFFDAIYAIVQKVLGVVIGLVPVGIFFVTATIIARNSGSIGNLFDGLGKFSLVLIMGFLLHAFLVIPFVLKFFAKRSPWEYFVNVLPAVKTALVSASPTVALPVTFENSIERNKIDSRVASLVLPVGSSLNVNGRALYVTVSALFIAQAFEVPLGFLGILYVAVAALFFSLGTGTVPFVGMLTLVSVMDFAGFPTSAYAGIGIIFVIDWIWARIFAALDVWSDAAVAAAVEESTTTQIYQPEKRIRPVYDPSRRFDRDRGQDRRDYPPRRSRDNRPRPDIRPDRPPRPYSRPEREPVPAVKSSPRPERSTDREKSLERSSPSPFELKADLSKPFSPELARAAGPPVKKPPPPKIDAPEARGVDRRKAREKKHFARGHDVAKQTTKEQETPQVVTETPITKVTSPSVSRPVAPPLIRDIESPKEIVSESPPKNETQKPDEQLSDDSEETQTSLFGRAPHRKGVRPKTDEPPKPVEGVESYSTKEQEFGRGIRKKKTT